VTIAAKIWPPPLTPRATAAPDRGCV